MLGLGGSVNLDIILDPNDRRKFLKFRENHKSVKLPIYSGSDDISGVVAVELKGTNRYEHLGLRIEIVGHLGTACLIQKSTATRTSARTSCRCPKSWSLRGS